MDRLNNTLDSMHKAVNETLTTVRRRAIERHNAKTHVTAYKPNVGYYVVVARSQGPRMKVSANWVGPRRVTRILSDFTVEVEHLVNGSTSAMHVSRIKPYVDSLVGTNVQIKKVADYIDHVHFSVDKIRNLRESSGGFEALVAWKGLSSSSDSWEPLNIVFEDLPSKVKQFFKRRLNSTHRRTKTSLGL